MATVNDILRFLSEWAPFDTGEKDDIIGLLAGRASAPVTRALVSLDVTSAVIAEAAGKGCELIIAHHPFFWGPPPFPTDTDRRGGAIALSLCENRIAAISMHTNLDAAPGGVNDRLSDLLGLENARTVLDAETGIGRCGVLPEPQEIPLFARGCREKLSCGVVRWHDAGRPAHRVAVCGGSGGGLLRRAQMLGCDTLVTADIRHHVFLEAAEIGMNLLDCGHFATENVVIPVIFDRMRRGFPEISVFQSQVNKEPYQCL